MKQFDPDSATTIALLAVRFIFAQDNLREGFLNLSGVSPSSLQERIENPEFLLGVLDFLLQREEALIQFCEENDLDPTAPSRAQLALSSI